MMDTNDFLEARGVRSARLARCIDAYKLDLDRIGFENHPLKRVPGIARVREAISDFDASKNDKWFFYKIYKVVSLDKEGFLLGEDFSSLSFFELQCFINQYRGAKYLPEVMPGPYDARSEDEIYSAMRLIVDPINDQKEFVDRLKLADELLIKNRNLNFSFLDLISFDGSESGNIALSGVKVDQGSEYYIFVRKVNDGCWEILRRERSQEILDLRLYSIQCVYEYLLNYHIKAVI